MYGGAATAACIAVGCFVYHVPALCKREADEIGDVAAKLSSGLDDSITSSKSTGLEVEVAPNPNGLREYSEHAENPLDHDETKDQHAHTRGKGGLDPKVADHPHIHIVATTRHHGANNENLQHANQSGTLNNEEKLAFQEENLYGPTEERPTHVHRESDPFRTMNLSIRSLTPTTQSLIAYHTDTRDSFSLPD